MNVILPHTKTCIIIAGPTAVGKTAAAIEIARHFNTEITSADSRQCYYELNIGVAKPSVEELAAMHHYFINSHSIHDNVTAAVFEQYALNAVNTIFKKSNVAVMVGGTGLYIKAFCEGLDDVPEIPALIRDDIKKGFEENGLDWLQQQVQQFDATYFEKGETKNPQRLMRALEVVLATGKSITSFQLQQKKQRPFNILQIGLELPREILYERINNRVEVMMQDGLLQEVAALQNFEKFNALQTVGYTEFFDYLHGHHSLEKAVELVKRNTRHYAKRQLTWFKRNDEMVWFSPLNITAIINVINAKIQAA